MASQFQRMVARKVGKVRPRSRKSPDFRHKKSRFGDRLQAGAYVAVWAALLQPVSAVEFPRTGKLSEYFVSLRGLESPLQVKIPFQGAATGGSRVLKKSVRAGNVAGSYQRASGKLSYGVVGKARTVGCRRRAQVGSQDMAWSLRTWAVCTADTSGSPTLGRVKPPFLGSRPID